MNEQWLEDLLNVVETKVSEVSKFKTHKLKNSFFGELRHMIKSAIHVNTQQKQNNDTASIRKSCITVPNPNKKTQDGFAIMTERESSEGDRIIGVGQ